MAITPLVATLLRKEAIELGSRKRSVAMVKAMNMAMKPMMAPALGDFARLGTDELARCQGDGAAQLVRFFLYLPHLHVAEERRQENEQTGQKTMIFRIAYLGGARMQRHDEQAGDEQEDDAKREDNEYGLNQTRGGETIRRTPSTCRKDSSGGIKKTKSASMASKTKTSTLMLIKPSPIASEAAAKPQARC